MNLCLGITAYLKVHDICLECLELEFVSARLSRNVASLITDLRCVTSLKRGTRGDAVG
jgi:hypothetical protein